MQIFPVGVVGTTRRINQVFLWSEELELIETGQSVEFNWWGQRQTGVLSGVEVTDGLALAWLD